MLRSLRGFAPRPRAEARAVYHEACAETNSLALFRPPCTLKTTPFLALTLRLSSLFIYVFKQIAPCCGEIACSVANDWVTEAT